MSGSTQQTDSAFDDEAWKDKAALAGELCPRAADLIQRLLYEASIRPTFCNIPSEKSRERNQKD